MATIIPLTSREWAERWQSGPGFPALLFGVLLPLGTLGFELATQICASMIFDPIPTPLHLIAVALVPAFNFIVWSSLTRGEGRPRLLAFANGIAIAIAAMYSVLFIPVLPVATIAIIYFGMGLLPWTPVFALATAITLRARLAKAADQEQRRFATWPGLVCGVVLLIAIQLPNTATEIGMKMAASPTPSEQTRGIRLLRAIGDEDQMLRACYFRSGRAMDWISLITQMSPVGPEQARNVYYRVTGEIFNAKPMPSNTRRDWWVNDFDQGFGIVGGRVQGLSLASSRFDGSFDPKAALGYLEWTLVMKNDSEMMSEARAQVALPPGAVVSRLTLWVNGEEREAAFAARGQVTEAYRSVVSQRRDPVLVTSAGADRISVQMFPVPAHGEMKVRIGMTVPLELDSLRQASLPLPYFHERNFDLVEGFKHSVWLESSAPLADGRHESHIVTGGSHALQLQLADDQLVSQSSIVTMSRDPLLTAWSNDKPAGAEVIKQTLQPVPRSWPARLVVVVDSSASMASSAQKIADSLSRLPKDAELFVIVADDVVDATAEPLAMTPVDAAALIRGYEFVGGKDNTAALAQALDLVLTKQDSALVWIHGPQPVLLQTTEALAQRLERRGQLRWYDVQVTPGPNLIGQNLDTLANIRTISLPALQSTFTHWRSGGDEYIARRERASNAAAPAAEQTSDHLARLWAYDEVRRLLYTERNSPAAIDLAHRYQLVTPVTGAVVLETQQQYDAAGLSPVPEGTVPSIPEPEEWALIAIAVLVLLYALRRRQAETHAAV